MPEYSVDMKADELRALMSAAGLTPANMTKAEMVAALNEHYDVSPSSFPTLTQRKRSAEERTNTGASEQCRSRRCET